MFLTALQQPDANPVTKGGLLADVTLLLSLESCVFPNVHGECNKVEHAQKIRVFWLNIVIFNLN